MIFATPFGADDVSIRLQPQAPVSTMYATRMLPAEYSQPAASGGGGDREIVPFDPPADQSIKTAPPPQDMPIDPYTETEWPMPAPQSRCPWWCWLLIAIGVTGTIGLTYYLTRK